MKIILAKPEHFERQQQPGLQRLIDGETSLP
jgi:hypothetical protein